MTERMIIGTRDRHEPLTITAHYMNAAPAGSWIAITIGSRFKFPTELQIMFDLAPDQALHLAAMLIKEAALANPDPPLMEGEQEPDGPEPAPEPDTSDDTPF